ncbi:MAG: hypothetical protein ACQEQI_07415 [Bacillota bacterium]
MICSICGERIDKQDFRNICRQCEEKINKVSQKMLQTHKRMQIRHAKLVK